MTHDIVIRCGTIIDGTGAEPYVGDLAVDGGVQRLTSAPAPVIGVKDRGVPAPGMRADINVFDADRVGERYPELAHDFPGRAPRYIQRSTGYHNTLVNGQVAFRDGVHSCARAGQVPRHAA